MGWRLFTAPLKVDSSCPILHAAVIDERHGWVVDALLTACWTCSSPICCSSWVRGRYLASTRSGRFPAGR
eukprot:scaffold7956_cov32-Tisochrysis_lutea.AAC.1